MNIKPSKKGWLTDYLDFRQGMYQDFLRGNYANDGHPDHSLYREIHPSGLMYGLPMHSKRNSIEWSEADSMKVLLAESLINGALIYQQQEISDAEDFGKVIVKTVNGIGEFYNKIYPEIYTSSRTFLGRKRSSLEIAEKILEKRIRSVTKSKTDNFWLNFFGNSLLFLDIYFYGRWVNTASKQMVSEFFKQEKLDMRFSVAKVIAAAAHANDNIEEEERNLFDHFIESANFTKEQIKEAKRILNKGVGIEEIFIPTHNSWILKKYFFELAILTVWSDRVIDELEYSFLLNFNKKLGFYDEDMENSILAVEGFILEHWNQLQSLQKKHKMDEVKEVYLNRVRSVTKHNSERIKSEIQYKSKISTLLKKATSGSINNTEEEELKNGLISILKNVPTFVILGLPSTFFSLPMLMEIMPLEHLDMNGNK